MHAHEASNFCKGWPPQSSYQTDVVATRVDRGISYTADFSVASRIVSWELQGHEVNHELATGIWHL